MVYKLLLEVSLYLVSLNAELASLNEAMMAAARYDRSEIMSCKTNEIT